MGCCYCDGPMDPEALKYYDPEEDDFCQCSKCMAAEYAAECASLEAAESGAGLERLRSDQYDMMYPQELTLDEYLDLPGSEG